jgi:hypothetical protein
VSQFRQFPFFIVSAGIFAGAHTSSIRRNMTTPSAALLMLSGLVLAAQRS